VRIFKLAIIGIILLFLAAFAISLLIPSYIRISKAINLHAEKDSVWSIVRNRNRWPEWHPAFMDDVQRFPPIKTSVLHQDDSLFILKLEQDNKRPVINGWQLFNSSQDSLTLQWYMDFKIGWLPWQKLGSLFFENTYGVMMQEGLTNIKRKEEKQQAISY
jgi:hypothetical protein